MRLRHTAKVKKYTADYCPVNDLCRASSIGTHGKEGFSCVSYNARQKNTNSRGRRHGYSYRNTDGGFAVRHITRTANNFIKIKKTQGPLPTPCCRPAGPTNENKPKKSHCRRPPLQPQAALGPRRRPPWRRRTRGRTLEKESASRNLSHRCRPDLPPPPPSRLCRHHHAPPLPKQEGERERESTLGARSWGGEEGGSGARYWGGEEEGPTTREIRGHGHRIPGCRPPSPPLPPCPS
jgi:hypothetical protein